MGKGDLVSIDFFGPLPPSVGGAKYILAVSDVYTKYVELYPIRNATTKIVINKMRNHYYVNHGKPKKIINAHGTQFTSQKWREALEDDGIRSIFSSIRHPQSNHVERVMRELGRFKSLNKYLTIKT